ncbi:hypothetical protein NLI96_g5747 [Meripilus lineatus]|uniref:Oligopeptide transporter n=1 Tax=Meripilus lineatus TaxID=2056292 RepID=A0AAD5V2I4_9APHY|nr:hypothetical protein NLI96_g5747 [Physisporinus lineatus]
MQSIEETVHTLSKSATSLGPVLHDPEKAMTPPSMIREGSLSPPPSQFATSLPDFFDPNLDVDTPWLEDDSPYPEVRSAVANYDDPSMPASTIRSWFLGIIWAIVIPAVNQFFYLRYPSIMVTGLVAQLVSFPLGRLWARIVPSVKIFGVSLNPGPFTIKEHVITTVMAGVGAQAAYATEIVAVQRVLYMQQFNFAYQWMLVMSTQVWLSKGYYSWRARKETASCSCFYDLAQCPRALRPLQYLAFAKICRHREKRGSQSGEILYICLRLSNPLVFCSGIPLSSSEHVHMGKAFTDDHWTKMNVVQVCWIAPDNVKINALFGYRSGMGFSLLSFDWNQIAFIGSPLATPWWAEANVVFGFVVFYWVLTPILYFSNVWYSQYMPISSSSSYDRTGQSS